MLRIIIQEEYDLGGSAIAESLNEIVSSIGEGILTIIAGLFSMFIDWITALAGGHFFGDSPAIFIIAIAFIFTAYMIHLKN